MSSISIAPVGFEFRRPSAQVRLTRRGRVVFLIAFLGVMAVVMVALSGLANAGSPQRVRHIQVAPGQTLTSIAQQVNNGGDIRNAIAEIEQMNHMSGAELQAGQYLVIPAN